MKIEIGDLITTYWKGFYQVTKIQKRWRNPHNNIHSSYELTDECNQEMNPLIYFIMKYSDEGKPVKRNKEQCCDASFCKLSSEEIPKRIIKLKETISNLEKLL